ncbi:DUF5673 domain-containing protein [Miniphocaeibacter halophilus]|uniref:Uncharacterized protein n=1 Tax=Miniphocaeibacter halophilus TaxID=2931922 RepID=A0AC61MRJ7_9FIRM|nr:DUF5673 domain-containing protein [Miniphocaeibacter halophilus]QQK07933.1 hypothetical protein JFY71_11810 [Miniphocaeibacter halophilus]
MLIYLSISIIALFFIIKRSLLAKNPIYIFKTNFRNDRIVELLVIFICIIVGITNIVNNYLVHNIFQTRNVIIFVSVVVVLIVLSILEYNKNQIGIYDNGLIMKSQFYKWKKIYTYRLKKLNGNKTKISFYFHDSMDEKKLSISSLNLTDEECEKVVEAIGENIDPTLS